MKKVLVVSFSQSGQLTEILDNFLKPLIDKVDVDRVMIKTKQTFPFPWSSKDFYNVMPESVLEEPMELEQLRFNYEEYDVIVVGYQPWYLSPSIPTSSLFTNEKFLSVIKNKPVITIIGSRNMWINAQERVKSFIKNAKGKLVANIPFVDRTTNLISAITILHWMSTGKKERKWGIFPYPGVSSKDIKEASLFGEIVLKSVEKNNYSHLQEELLKLGKIKIRTNLMFIESRAKKLFTIWAKTIKNKGTTPEKRVMWLKIFKYYLQFALFIVSPLVLLIFNVTVRPLTFNNIKKKKEYFSSVKLN